MKKRTLIIIGVLLLVSSPSAATAQNQDRRADWATVKTISPGERLAVKLKDGGTVRGNLISVSDQALELTGKSATASLEQTRISKVYRVVKRTRMESAARSAWIGAGIGFGSGAGVGIALGSYEDVSAAGLAVALGAVGAAIGAAAGTVTGLIAREKRVIVYEVK